MGRVHRPRTPATQRGDDTGETTAHHRARLAPRGQPGSQETETIDVPTRTPAAAHRAQRSPGRPRRDAPGTGAGFLPRRVGVTPTAPDPDYRQVFDATPAPLLLLTPRLTIVAANQSPTATIIPS